MGLGRHGEEGLVDHHVSLGWVSSRKLLQPLHAHLGHEGEDDEEDGDVEDKVGDGDPVLERGPVMGDHNPHVLQAGENRDNHPSHKEALVPSISPNNKEESAEDPKEGVENGVLDERADADVFAFTFIPIWIEVLGVLDNIEDGGDDGDEELNDADDDDTGLEWDAKARSKARPSSHRKLWKEKLLDESSEDLSHQTVCLSLYLLPFTLEIFGSKRRERMETLLSRTKHG